MVLITTVIRKIKDIIIHVFFKDGKLRYEKIRAKSYRHWASNPDTQDLFLTHLDLQNIFCMSRANSRRLLSQRDKFSITAQQIPGTQSRHPDKPTARVWGNPTGKAGAAKSNSPAVSGVKLPLPHLPRSHHLFSLLPGRGAAPPWRMHLWSITQAGQEERWRITSRRTPSPHTGPARPHEPGIFTTAEHFALQTYWQGRTERGREVVNV